MLPLFARAGAAMIPGGSRLPWIGSASRGDGLPELTLVLEAARVDPERLADYDRVCRFPLRDRLPVTYPHLLAFPLQLSLMTDPDFPFPALGLVHIANRIAQHRPIRISEALRLKVWAADLRPHPRGTQFDLRSEAWVGEQLVWEERSTILRRGGSRSNLGGGSGESGGSRADAEERHGGDAPQSEERHGGGAPQSEERHGAGAPQSASAGGAGQQSEQTALPPTATWRLPGDLGRRYASVSGDRNPIHLHPLSARLFGFPTAIVHGMWTKARCLAALDPRLPEHFSVEVQFRRPILLPATVEFCEAEDADGISFAVRGAGKGTPHLDGRVSFR